MDLENYFVCYVIVSELVFTTNSFKNIFIYIDPEELQDIYSFTAMDGNKLISALKKDIINHEEIKIHENDIKIISISKF